MLFGGGKTAEVFTTESGRRESVVISCVTFETYKVANPIRFYRADRVYLIHYTDLTKAKGKEYKLFFDRVCELVRENSASYGKDVEIIEVNRPVYNYKLMLSIIFDIIYSEKRARGERDIYVNVTAGSPEFTAAATLASMMWDGVVPFSVGAKGFTIVAGQDVKHAYYEDDGRGGYRPVGLALDTYDPRVIPVYRVARPDETLVRGLRIFKTQIEEAGRTGSTRAAGSGTMVRKLKEAGLWKGPGSPGGGSRTKEAVAYQRQFLDKWIGLGWVEGRGRDYRLTESGDIIAEVFYRDLDGVYQVLESPSAPSAPPA